VRRFDLKKNAAIDKSKPGKRKKWKIALVKKTREMLTE